ncbi:MAG: TIGR02300 family protein [Hyphomicrobiales bacterium]|nr:TIGR02300 family protein [Hyphomicrobiales bacterium]MDE2018366.1 TIGR02300 family protein [Hyphomicrobiales bacterium]
MAKPELGVKRHCLHCGAKFFDMNKSPISCPKCGTVFEGAIVPRAPAPVAAKDDEEGELPVAGPELVSLEEAEPAEAKVAGAEDVDVDDDEDEADDPFLAPEEEDEDDVTGLIDGEIPKDEET